MSNKYGSFKNSLVEEAFYDELTKLASVPGTTKKLKQVGRGAAALGLAGIAATSPAGAVLVPSLSAIAAAGYVASIFKARKAAKIARKFQSGAKLSKTERNTLTQAIYDGNIKPVNAPLKQPTN